MGSKESDGLKGKRFKSVGFKNKGESRGRREWEGESMSFVDNKGKLNLLFIIDPRGQLNLAPLNICDVGHLLGHELRKVLIGAPQIKSYTME